MEPTPRGPGRFVTAVALLPLVCFGGCASTATIQRTDGPDSEGRIVSSDAGAVWVSARNGQTYRIGRESVSAIDHPGNVEILIGSILVGLASLVAVSVYEDGDRDAVLPVALVYGGPGLAMMISGGYRYMSSTQAAQAFESAEPPFPAPPPPPLPPVWMPMPPPGVVPPPPLQTLPAPPPAGTTLPAPPAPPPPEPEVRPDPPLTPR